MRVLRMVTAVGEVRTKKYCWEWKRAVTHRRPGFDLILFLTCFLPTALSSQRFFHALFFARF